MRADNVASSSPSSHRDGALQHDDSVVQLFIHKMHRAAGDANSILQRLTLRIEARKCRQQRRMNIQNRIGKGGHKFRRQQAHISSQANQFHAMFAQAGDDFGILLGALSSARLQSPACVRPRACGRGNPSGIRAIGNDNGNFRVFDFAAVNRVGNRQKVGTTTGEKNAKTRHDEI